jgi:hypothetical protein
MIAVYCISQDGQGWSISMDGEPMESGLPLEIAVRASVIAAARRHRNDPRSDTKVVFCDRGADYTLWRNGKVSPGDQPGPAAASRRAA